MLVDLINVCIDNGAWPDQSGPNLRINESNESNGSHGAKIFLIGMEILRNT